jgi:hypothetical protein
MFIAMNRFKVIKGAEAAFENVWLSRDSHLEKVPGFVEFHLLKGPEAEDHTLYASHTVWQNRARCPLLGEPDMERLTSPAKSVEYGPALIHFAGQPTLHLGKVAIAAC